MNEEKKQKVISDLREEIRQSKRQRNQRQIDLRCIPRFFKG
ncbi:hypothetical protein [Eubacterium sp. 1001713B170207_170306_E7]|nr:hypothetical protein [Eubacterium sp. 1001713B170207_170306_E7]